MITNFLRLTLISLAMVSFMSRPAWGFGIGLQPTTLEIDITPGERQRQVINIANVHKEQTIALTIGLADWSLDKGGQIELTPPGETLSSASDWARFSPAFLTLKPGEAQQIIVDIAVPSRLSRAGDFRFALIASTILPEERSGQSGVWKKYQIASLFYLTTERAESAPRVTSSTVALDEAGIPHLELGIENTGNAHARLNGSIDLTIDGDTKNLPVANVVVLHESAREYAVPLPEGAYDGARVEVRLENTFAPQNEDKFELLPVYKGPAFSHRAQLPAASDQAPSDQ